MNNLVLIKIIRGFIIFISMYLVLKYCTLGKIPYHEIFMISSTAVLIQSLLDIYQPLVIIEESKHHGP